MVSAPTSVGALTILSKINQNKELVAGRLLGRRDETTVVTWRGASLPRACDPLHTNIHGKTLNKRILITGSSGLVGSALSVGLEEAGAGLSLLDVRAEGTSRGDVREAARVREALEGCDGVIHLAAISRVIWGEQRPEECWDVNVNGVRNVLEAAACAGSKPWVIFASSREVYGQPSSLPACEETPLAPVNVYGRAKVRGEELVEAARRQCGLTS